MSQPPDLAFTRGIPKVELHAHLTGSISRQSLHKIWQRKKANNPSFDLEDPLTAIPRAADGEINVTSFFPIFDKYVYALISDQESIQHAAISVLEDFQDDGVRYVELRTTPRAIPDAGISKEDYVTTVLRAMDDFKASVKENIAGAPPYDKLHARLILSIDRKNTLEEAFEVVRLALKYRHLGIVGIDLCGNPARNPISHLRPAFAEARAQGLGITLHFAEIAQEDPSELEEMLSWQPQRLGHVIHVPEELRKVITEKKLGLELCLSCNILCGLSQGGFAAHHFGEWWNAGVPIALSTDDVGIFESTLSNEYALAALNFDLDRTQLLIQQINISTPVMEDYSKGLWQAAKVYEIFTSHPETIVLKSTRKKFPTAFFVNKGVLCHYSTYFDKFFNGPWKESQKPPPEIKVDLSQKDLRLFHAWLYTGRILTDFDPDSIIALWIYGDFIDSLALRRATLTHLSEMSLGEGLISYKSLNKSKIWTEHRGSPLYQWIVMCFAMHWHHSMDEQVEDPFKQYDIPISFLYDLMKIRSKSEHMVDKGDIVGDCPCCSGICKYHEHLNDEEREATCEAGQYEILSTVPHDDADDIDEDGEEAVDENGNQDIYAEMEEETKEVDVNAIVNESVNTSNEIEMSGENQQVEGNAIVNQSIDTSDNFENTEMNVNGKRKAHDDGEEEVSAKKHKQEAES
ncbi:Metallo-dependent hydrolase, partial [Aureobasidium melanogenum]